MLLLGSLRKGFIDFWVHVPLCAALLKAPRAIVSSAVYKEELQAQNLSFLQRFRGQSCEEQDSLPLLRESMSRMICSERSNGHLMLPSAPPIFVTSGHCFITQPPAAAGSFHPDHHHWAKKMKRKLTWNSIQHLGIGIHSKMPLNLRWLMTIQKTEHFKRLLHSEIRKWFFH